MKLGISKLLKKILGGEAPPPTTATPTSRSTANNAMAARLAKINAAEARIIAAQAKIEELTPKLEEAKLKETAAGQTLLAKAKAGEDTRQYAEAQKRAHDDVVSFSKSIITAKMDLAAAIEEKAKA